MKTHFYNKTMAVIFKMQAKLSQDIPFPLITTINILRKCGEIKSGISNDKGVAG